MHQQRVVNSVREDFDRQIVVLKMIGRPREAESSESSESEFGTEDD